MGPQLSGLETRRHRHAACSPAIKTTIVMAWRVTRLERDMAAFATYAATPAQPCPHRRTGRVDMPLKAMKKEINTGACSTRGSRPLRGCTLCSLNKACKLAAARAAPSYGAGHDCTHSSHHDGEINASSHGPSHRLASTEVL